MNRIHETSELRKTIIIIIIKSKWEDAIEVVLAEAKVREYQRLSFLEEIRDESGRFGRFFGGKEFGSEEPENNHAYDSGEAKPSTLRLLLPPLRRRTAFNCCLRRRHNRRRERREEREEKKVLMESKIWNRYYRVRRCCCCCCWCILLLLLLWRAKKKLF